MQVNQNLLFHVHKMARFYQETDNTTMLQRLYAFINIDFFLKYPDTVTILQKGDSIEITLV